ncbi:hypothetical protein GCK72_021317 [Caenorhabditis remanei]|uniref:Fork-head domain-containing protein n=1 Tax=Caenorhabditis remanei TaxID=31234 RepID=A0A6A5GJ83_CAERE|nr:hypothetical protein GCK72_021317 [Caenorhabditis remanei]KAF1754753.1 hypothetical protein GCK72_021317 [Caenorhabditis remanei]
MSYNFNDDSKWFTSPEDLERDGDISIDFDRNVLEDRDYCSQEQPWGTPLNCNDDVESSQRNQIPHDQDDMDCGNQDLDVYGDDDFGQDFGQKDIGTDSQVLNDNTYQNATSHVHLEVPQDKDYAPQQIQTAQIPESTEILHDDGVFFDSFQDPIMDEIQQQIQQYVGIDENGNKNAQQLVEQQQSKSQIDMNQHLIPVNHSQGHQKQHLDAQDRPNQDYQPNIQEQQPSTWSLPIQNLPPGPYRLTTQERRLLRTSPYSTKSTVPKKGSQNNRFVGLIPSVLLPKTQTSKDAPLPRSKTTPNPKFLQILIWRSEKNQRPAESLPRPAFSYQVLAMMACMNSPSRSVTPQEVYSFLLHHFPYYRFVVDQDSWKSSVRNALCSEKYFWKISGPEKELMYKIRSEEAVGFTKEESAWIETDPRGKEFFSKMALGHLGLPRQLFYTIIGIGCPQYAGPENSALFYHLWSLGLDFNDLHNENPFRIHVSPFEGAEPVFDEGHEFLKMGRKRMLVEKRFGYGCNLEDGEKKWLMEENSKFFENLHWYFEQMEEMKRRNMENWTTPSLVRTNFLV